MRANTKLGVVVVALLVGCGSHSPHATPAKAEASSASTAQPGSLYERLGGKPAVTAVVHEFVARTTTDDRIKDRFFNVDGANLEKLLVQFVCMAGGGGCTYEGRDMTTSHASMEIADEEWDALVGDLVGALDKFKVPDKEKNDLLGALGPLKPQIVAPKERLDKRKIDDGKLAEVTKLAGSVSDPEEKRLLEMAVTAGHRGQRSYAEQLFSRAEMIGGPASLAKIASVFRAGAPERITTAPKKVEDTGPQPKVVGKEDEPAPKPKAVVGSLHGTVKLDGKAAAGMGVVMLYPAKGGYGRRTPKQRIMEQRNKEFAPHILAVPVGSTVSFPNFDPLYHNVFSLSKAKAFDLGMYKRGETRDVTLDKPGIIRLGCNLHANMSAYIIVVDAPHYALVDDSGDFSFRALAPGKYKLVAWHEPGGDPSTTEIEVKEGANTKDVDFKATAATLGTDKFGNSR